MTNYQETTVRLDDIDIHYLSWGDPASPPILFLHGYLDIAHCWVDVAGPLSQDYYCVAPNFRGHGDSGWSKDSYGYWMPHYLYDWTLLLDHLGWESCRLVGHSMGANCASLLAGTYPKRFEQLVMVEGFGVPMWSPNDAPERMRDHIYRRRPEHFRSNKEFATFEEVVERILESNPRYPRARAEMLAQHGAKQTADGAWAWKFDPRVRIPNPAMYPNSQFEVFWKKIKAPTLQVVGAESAFRAFVTPQLWNIPEQHIVYLPGAMHMVQHEVPELLTSVLRAFFSAEYEKFAEYERPFEVTSSSQPNQGEPR